MASIKRTLSAAQTKNNNKKKQLKLLFFVAQKSANRGPIEEKNYDYYVRTGYDSNECVLVVRFDRNGYIFHDFDLLDCVACYMCVCV